MRVEANILCLRGAILRNPRLYKITISLLFLLAIGISELYAQKIRIDSLEKLLPEIQDEKRRVGLLNDLCFTYYAIDPNKGTKYCESALNLASEIKFDSGLVQSNYYLGITHWSLGEYDSAINYLDMGIQIAKKKQNARITCSLL